MIDLGIPLANQLAGEDANKHNNCGPACGWMVGQWLGILPASGTVRDVKAELTGDWDWTGYTYTHQMVAWFNARGVPAVQVQPEDVAGVIRAALARGHATIYLSYWDLGARSGGHFRVAAAMDADIVRLNNPWGAVVDRWTDGEVNGHSLANWLVLIRQARPAPPTRTEEETVDILLPSAKARWEALGVSAFTDGMLFKTYLRVFKAWVEDGQDGVRDPPLASGRSGATAPTPTSCSTTGSSGTGAPTPAWSTNSRCTSAAPCWRSAAGHREQA